MNLATQSSASSADENKKNGDVIPTPDSLGEEADVTLFLHATSGRLSLTESFFLRRFPAFYCFKCYLGSFARCKTAFSPNSIPPKHAEQDQINAKWLQKRLFADERVEEQVEA